MSKKVKNSCRSLYLTTALVTSIALMHPAKSYAAVGLLDTPTGHTVVGGAATFANPVAGQLNVNQSTDRVIINWDSFNIGASATTQFNQPHSSSLAVNRVLSAGTDPTQILGTLNANGRLMVLDRNGVIFEPGSSINVGGIIASTGDVSDATVMSKANLIPLVQGTSTGLVENDGTITVADKGLAALVAPTAINRGTITAKLGKVYLDAGETATVDLFGDGLISLATASNLTHALVANRGTINAEGGTITMSTAVAKGILDNEINLRGVVNASSATMQGGKIILTGDARVKIGGTLDADGTKGGTIEIAGNHVNLSGAATARGTKGNGGSITMKGTGVVDVSGTLDASGDPSGGKILVSGTKVDIGAKGSALAMGGGHSGKGGSIELDGVDYAHIVGLADASGGAGGGNIIMNGKNVDIAGTANAFSTSAGQGGNITLNADGSIELEGLLDAHGIDGGGNIKGKSLGGLEVTKTGQLFANSTGHGAGGDISLTGLLGNQISGRLDADGVNHGGSIEMFGFKVDLAGIATAMAGGGGGEEETSLTTQFDVAPSSSEGSGHGGKIVLNSDTMALLVGTADASGVDSGGEVDVIGRNIDHEGNAYAKSTTHGSGGEVNFTARQGITASGNIDVSGVDHGGSIDVTGGTNVKFSGNAYAKATTHGSGGDISFNAGQDLKLTGNLDASGANHGGDVTLTGGNSLNVSGTVLAESFISGIGGTIGLNAPTVKFSGLLNVDGVNGGGNATLTGGTISSTGTISADATSAGNGGFIGFVASVINKIFSGTLSATGGPASGNGGTVDVSTPNIINAGVVVDVSAPSGSAGTYNH